VHLMIAQPPAERQPDGRSVRERLRAISLEERLRLAQRLLVPEVDLDRFVNSSREDLLANLTAPRLRETLSGLTDGLSQKEIAQRLCISKNTVHVYVKDLYRRFGVRSVTELLALFIDDDVRIRLRQP
jgi:DNA-binding NarL/FixJ family response regulator